MGKRQERRNFFSCFPGYFVGGAFKIAQRERVDVYTIPPNFAQEGTILSGRVRFRNAFEAGILGVFLLQILLSMDFGIRVKIYVGVAVLIPALIFAILGIQGESLTSFLFQFLKYLNRRRMLTVPDGKYRLKRNRRLAKLKKKSRRGKGGGNHRKRGKGTKAEAAAGKAGGKEKPERREEEPKGAAEEETAATP